MRWHASGPQDGILTHLSHLAALERSAFARVRRFLSVTVVTAFVGQLVITVLHLGAGLDPLLANALAVAVVTAVGYTLSTRYVWPSDPARRFRVEVPAFITLSIVGLVASSLGVWMFTSIFGHPLAANAGSAFSYGLVWVARFVFLDRVVFTRSADQVAGVTVERS